MDISIVSMHSENAIKYYKSDNKKFNESMAGFYSEGKKNPSIAKIIFKENRDSFIKKASDATTELLKAETMSMDPFVMRETEMSLGLATSVLSKQLAVMNLPKDKALDSIPEKKEFDKAYRELYPKTADIRERIIDAGQIKTDAVTPKASYVKKNFALRTVAELKETYPKTYNARTKLILFGQIRDNEVTKKVKGFFERMSYRPFIEKGFGFAKKALK